MKTSLASKNWVQAGSPAILKKIHEVDVNIALLDRDISLMQMEISSLTEQDFELRSSGDTNTIVRAIDDFKELENCFMIKQDIKDLLHLFGEVSGSKSFKMLLATVKNNMCRKFHTDINDLRMLCTYAGPGTMWVQEDDLTQAELDAYEENDEMAINESNIQQAKTGSVIILKGAIYPKEGSKAILHRSPTIEECGDKRLLLRIDTDAFLNFE